MWVILENLGFSLLKTERKKKKEKAKSEPTVNLTTPNALWLIIFFLPVRCAQWETL